ncbi:MAG: hypothetical protein OXR62_08390 [Ahrensia sp.]|nr:hypothetical protein [Ahrensia sp.]
MATRLLIRAEALVVLAIFVSGCTSTSTISDLFAVETAPQRQTEATNTGTFPTVGRVPVGATSQLSPSQTRAEKQELVRAAAKGRWQANVNSRTAYDAEVARLRKLAQDQQKRREEALKAAAE